MTALLPIERDRAVEAARPWRVHLAALAGLAGAILLLFHGDATDLAQVWLSRSTYNHCALILPIIAWLVWQRLPELKRLEPAAWAPGLLLLALGAFCWLLGEAGFVAIARQAGLVLMLQGAVIACLGRSVARGLLFPLAYALFMIPVGDGLMPPMQTLTAQMSMALLGLVGVPAHIEGVFITIPNGYFEVAEACSGVEFLIAMTALGAVVANLCFSSMRRRLLFMAAAILLPVVANGIRAFGTIYIAHLTDITFAAGFDHVVYGWFFFAFIVAVLLAGSWRFFDRGPNDPWFDPEALAMPGTGNLRAVGAVAAAMVLFPFAWSFAMAASRPATASLGFELPRVPGWERVAADEEKPWKPRFEGADVVRLGRYRDGAGREVDLAVAVFSRQEQGREIVGFGQGAIDPEGRWAWTATGASPHNGRSEKIASFGTLREVLSFYRIGSILTGSEYRVKLETMKERLAGRPGQAAAVLVSAEAPAEGADPRPAIDAFLAALGPVEAVADRSRGL